MSDRDVDIAVIRNKLENIEAKVTEIASKIRVQNGRVGKNEAKILSIVSHLDHIKESVAQIVSDEKERNDGIRGWGRQKALIWIGLVQSVIIILIGMWLKGELPL